MPDPLHDLEARRSVLYEQLAQSGDLRRGTVTETYRRCGRPNCRCADPNDPGHGPRHLLTRSVAGKTEGRQVAPEELDKVTRETAGYKRFNGLVGEIVGVNEQICEARPLPIGPLAEAPAEIAGDPPIRGSTRISKRSSRPR